MKSRINFDIVLVTRSKNTFAPFNLDFLFENTGWYLSFPLKYQMNGLQNSTSKGAYFTFYRLTLQAFVQSVLS